MRVNIGSLTGRKGAFLKVEKELSGDFMEAYPEIQRIKGPIKIRLTVTNSGEGFLVAGSLRLQVELCCSRCLKAYGTGLEAQVEETFRTGPGGEGAEQLFQEEETAIFGDELDLTEVIEECLAVSIPMKTVCRDDCPGLCPVCGADLSLGQCSCPSPEVDIRLAPLSALLQPAKLDSQERRKEYGGTKKKTFKGKG